MLRVPRLYTLPEIVGGHPLSHFVGVIIPEATTNLVTNPSFETGTTSWTLSNGASIAQSATEQYHGTYSLAITPAATTFGGAFFGTVSLTAGTTYTASCKIKGAAGVPYRISIATTGAVSLAERNIIGTGRWQWIWVTYTETSSTTRRIYVTKGNSASASVFYVDGVQVEAKAYVTTYCDGDQLGLLVGQVPAPYLWTGTPHASASTRSALTRAGGRVMDIRSAYGFLLTGLIGLGMATPNNVSIPYTVLDGARYQRTTKPARTISMTGRFQATTTAQLDRLRSDLRAALDRDLVPIQQPLVLLVEPRDDCGNATGDVATIPCLYAGGLEGNDTSALAEDAAPTFTMYVPFLSGGDAGAALSVQLSVSNANDILYRSPSGTWSALGTGGNGTVNALAVGLDGTIYAGGAFTSMGGVANTNRIAKWNGSAWSALGTGMNDDVSALAIDAAGNLYAGGLFTTAGGGAANRIAKWNGSAWSALSTGLSGGLAPACNALVFTPNGTLYVGGDFTDAGGSGADYIASWNGSAFSTVGGATALNASVDSLARDAAGNVYAGGTFTNAGAVADADRIAKWNGSAWSALGTGGASDEVFALAVGPNGVVYAGGVFTTIGGVSVNKVAAWNGTGWAPLGTGVNNTVLELAIAPNGNLYAGGLFTTAGGITLPDTFAIWNGSAWVYADVDLPTTPDTHAILSMPDGSLYVGYSATGTATAAAVTTVTNSAPGYVYPRLVINGPSSGTSRIYQIVNYTTGVAVYLNLTLNTGETAIFDFDPQHPSFTTTFQGDITNAILPGSQPALMYLAPGANSVSFFAAASTVTATLSWQRRYNGLADLVN